MRIKDNAELRLECAFANHEEIFSLKFEHVGERWYWGWVSITQCSCEFKVPFVFWEDNLLQFIREVHDLESKLHIANHAIKLLTFCHQNAIIIGPLIPHQGLMFLNFHTSRTLYSDPSMVSTGYADEYQDKYFAMREMIDDFPTRFDTFSRRACIPDAVRKHMDPMLKELLYEGEDQESLDLSYGVNIDIIGLQFHRSQLKGAVDDLFEY